MREKLPFVLFPTHHDIVEIDICVNFVSSRFQNMLNVECVRLRVEGQTVSPPWPPTVP